MSNYTTREMAKLCNVSVRTVQFYDQEGGLVLSKRFFRQHQTPSKKAFCIHPLKAKAADEFTTTMI